MSVHVPHINNEHNLR